MKKQQHFAAVKNRVRGMEALLKRAGNVLVFQPVRRVMGKGDEGKALRIERGEEGSGRFHFKDLRA